MKMFSLKNLIGLAAVGGAVAYARKHGGVKNAMTELMSKKDELLSKFSQRTEQQDVSQGMSNAGSYGSTAESIGGSYSSGYGGTNGLHRR